MALDTTNLLNHPMSNPNTNAIMSMINNSFNYSKPTATGFKIVHVGVDRLPISILNIVFLSSKFWQKITCFDSLAKAMRGHMDSLSILDLVTAFSSDLPVDSTTAYVEASDARKDNR